jgi:hypothetical protein
MPPVLVGSRTLFSKTGHPVRVAITIVTTMATAIATGTMVSVGIELTVTQNTTVDIGAAEADHSPAV